VYCEWWGQRVLGGGVDLGWKGAEQGGGLCLYSCARRAPEVGPGPCFSVAVAVEVHKG